MQTVSTVNDVLWGVQIFLALFFVGASIPKLSGRGVEGWTGFDDLPRGVVLFIGSMELLGAVGLVLPMATGILPWLTPLSAVGLAITVLMAAGFHIRGDERLETLETVLWGCIASCVAVGRWSLIASRFESPSWTLVIALAFLVPPPSPTLSSSSGGLHALPTHHRPRGNCSGSR